MITATEMRNAIFASISVRRRALLRFGRDRFKMDVVPDHSLYAAFIFSSIAKAISDAKWLKSTALHGKEFVFSLGRGNIASTTGTFSYITFRKHRKNYELHCGLNVQSKVHGVVVEVDVLVIPCSHGTECRNTGKQISYKQIHTLVEVKHYERRFDISKAKEFVGTCSLVRYRRSYAGLVTKGHLTGDALKLFANIRPKIESFPNSDLAGANRMANEVVTALSKILK